jgi:hypothetical protein
LLIAVAPSAYASFTAAPRLAKLFVSDSTSRILQRGQTAETISRSRSISWPQPVSPAGGAVPPRWLTFRKQPFAAVQGGNPNWLRYVATSDAALGLS